MKKITSFFIFIFVIISNINAQQGKPAVLESSYDGITLHYTTGGLEVEEAVTTEGIFSRIILDGSCQSAEIGLPELPVQVSLMEIPLCESIRFQILDATYDEYSSEELGIGHILLPAQPTMSKSYRGETPFEKDAQAYARDEFYGRSLIQVEKSGVARNINIATVYFSPISYNPVSGRVRVCRNLTVAFTFEGADIPATYEMKALHGNAFYNGLQSRVVNPIAPLGREEAYARPVSYLIVANSMFRGHLDEFVAWKQRQGLVVEVAYTDDPAVGTTSATITDFIKGKYTNATPDNPAPTYLLLVGDVAQMPTYTSSLLDSHPTDLYYATWTDGDNIPDCYYGRFSAQTTAQLDAIVEKTLQYEQYTMPDPTYLDKVVLTAGEDGGSSGDYGYSHGNPTMHYLTNNYINSESGFSEVNTFYNPHPSSDAAQIRSILNQGVGFANYTAHCSPTGWSSPAFSTSHISAMDNAGRYGFMIGNCCQSSKFSESECFAEAITRTAGKGAVAYIGGSESTYWNEDYYWAVGLRTLSNNCSNCNETTYDSTRMGFYDRLFHTHGERFGDWYVTGGAIVQAGNLAVESSTSSRKLYYWEIYHLMGDPSILPWLTQAEPMTVTTDDVLMGGTTELQVTAVPHAYVALTLDGVVIAAVTADANGVANLTFAPVVPGSAYELAITAQNYQPYFKTLEAISPSGPYVVASDVHLADGSSGDYGTEAHLAMTVRNVGVADAANITIVLTTESEQASVVAGSVSLASLAQGAQQAYPDAFTVQIVDEIADNTVIPFRLRTIFDEDTTFTTYYLTVHAPSLANTAIATIETEGNLDGNINPGESCVLRVTTRNAGHAAAHNVMSHLVCTYEHATLLNSDAAIGEIAAGANAISEFQIRIGEQVPEPFIIPFIHQVEAGSRSFTDTLFVFVSRCTEDFETGDFSRYSWTNSSQAWTVGTTNPYDGSYCAISKSGMSMGNKCSLSLSITATADDSISYYRRYQAVSSWFGSDEFNFYIDNVSQEAIQESCGWERVSFPISAGTHTIKFEFARNAYSQTSSVAAVDHITFPINGEMAPLAIEELSARSISLYPNPATDQITLSVPEPKGEYAVVLFDINGRLLMERKPADIGNALVLDIAHLADGIYIVTLFNNEETLTTKLVKKR